MSRVKKTRKTDIEVLRKILENPKDPSVANQLSANDTALESIRRRLTGQTEHPHRIADPVIRQKDSLQPTVTVRRVQATEAPQPPHPAELPRFEAIPSTLPEFKPVTPATETARPSHEEIHPPEDLYEVEKVEVRAPEFIEIAPPKPAQSRQTAEPPVRHKEQPPPEEDLPEWQPVEDTTAQEPFTKPPEKPQPTIPEFKQIDPSRTTSPDDKQEELYFRLSKKKVDEQGAEPPTTPSIPVLPSPSKKAMGKREREERKAVKQQAKAEKRQRKLEEKILKREARQKEKQQHTAQHTPVPPPEPTPAPPVEEPAVTVDTAVFQNIPSIDQHTAEILYTHGYFSVENLQEATLEQLTQIPGLKKPLAKQIKKDVEHLLTPPPEPEFTPTKKKKQAKRVKQEPEEITEWESYHVDEETGTVSSTLACTYEEYTLYKREGKKLGGKTTTLHFFSKEQPAEGQPSLLPKGYRVAINKKTGVPFLKKKK
ncbi:MAG: hypothetical protein JXA00_04210 [Candidatus Thermoplasmatota archaeon]|nr:hypothetical protein [Candidatus Thermoplasmatota archaeon]